MKAVILAGGKGTRLQNIARDIPKPMVDIGGKPLLEHQVQLLKRYDVREVYLIVNYLKDVIIDYFGDGSQWGMNIRYFEEKQPMGTVGGIKEIEGELTTDFLAMYGDVMVNMNLKRLIAYHKSKKSEATLVVHPNDHPYDSDLIELDNDHRVQAVLSKPHPEGRLYHNMVNAGVYVFSPSILYSLEKGVKADFGKDIFPAIYNKSAMYGYSTSEYLKDMGTPDRLELVTNDLASGKTERLNLEHPQKAIFLDRDGVLNEDRDLIDKKEDLVLYPYTASALQRINRSEYLSVVATNQSVVARNLCSEQELKEIHKKMETELGNQHAYLDAIYYCPHHPDKGYPEENATYKIECRCRKPDSGMLEEAAKDYHINCSQSYLIGDSERDVVAGKKAGATTIGVMTGKGLKTAEVLPDYFFRNLKEAVDFIIDEPYRWLLEEVLESRKGQSPPFVVLIGGNTRAGKSTLSTYLSRSLEQQRHTVQNIELDHWILPREQRLPEYDVYQRFRWSRLEQDMTDLFFGKQIEAPGYSHHPQRNAKKKTYQIGNEEFVMIEGVVALSSEVLRQHADLSIFADIDDDTLKQSFFDFYRWKGRDDDFIEQLFASRKEDEYDVIKNDRKFADIITNSFAQETKETR